MPFLLTSFNRNCMCKTNMEIKHSYKINQNQSAERRNLSNSFNTHTKKILNQLMVG